MKKLTGYFLLAAIGLAAVIFALGYAASFLVKSVDSPPLAVIIPEKLELGDRFEAAFHLELPIYRSIEDVSLTLGNNLIQVGEIDTQLDSYRWLKKVYFVSAQIRVVRLPEEGKTPENFFRIILSDPVGQAPNPAIQVALPLLDIAPLDEAAGSPDLYVAGTLPPGKTTWGAMLWIATGVLVLGLILLGIFLMWRRNNQVDEVVLSNRERALQLLSDLSNDIRNRKIGHEKAFTTLVDIVRRYLEDEFHIAVSSRTTQEFLEYLGRERRAFPEAMQGKLKNFLTGAELVKFARAPLDDQSLLYAIEQAEYFIVAEIADSADSAAGGDAAEGEDRL